MDLTELNEENNLENKIIQINKKLLDSNYWKLKPIDKLPFYDFIHKDLLKVLDYDLQLEIKNNWIYIPSDITSNFYRTVKKNLNFKYDDSIEEDKKNLEKELYKGDGIDHEYYKNLSFNLKDKNIIEQAEIRRRANIRYENERRAENERRLKISKRIKLLNIKIDKIKNNNIIGKLFNKSIYVSPKLYTNNMFPYKNGGPIVLQEYNGIKYLCPLVKKNFGKYYPNIPNYDYVLRLIEYKQIYNNEDFKNKYYKINGPIPERIKVAGRFTVPNPKSFHKQSRKNGSRVYIHNNSSLVRLTNEKEMRDKEIEIYQKKYLNQFLEYHKDYLNHHTMKILKYLRKNNWIKISFNDKIINNGILSSSVSNLDNQDFIISSMNHDYMNKLKLKYEKEDNNLNELNKILGDKIIKTCEKEYFRVDNIFNIKRYHYSLIYMENKIINILLEIRKDFINHIKKNKIKFKSGLTIEDNYNIVEFNERLIPNSYEYDIHGYTMIKVNKWNQTKKGIKLAIDRTVEFIAMRFKDNNNFFLSIEAIIHTFLHELAHTITMPEIHKSNNLNNKSKKLQPLVKNKKKIPFHHSQEFYKNFSQILRIAEKLNIYKLPKNYRNFAIKGIKRYDTMINPYDNISLGNSSKYSKYKF